MAARPADEHTIVNPTRLLEVLSPSAEAYDRGEKLEHYERIDSLRACALVAPDRREVELWTRVADGPWARALLGPGAALELAAIGARLDVDAVSADAREPTWRAWQRRGITPRHDRARRDSTWPPWSPRRCCAPRSSSRSSPSP